MAKFNFLDMTGLTLVKDKILGIINNHTSNNDIHTSLEDKTKLSEAHEHSESTHAPTDAEKNIIVGVKKNGEILEIDSDRMVNVTIEADDLGDAVTNTVNAALKSTVGYVNINYLPNEADEITTSENLTITKFEDGSFSVTGEYPPAVSGELDDPFATQKVEELAMTANSQENSKYILWYGKFKYYDYYHGNTYYTYYLISKLATAIKNNSSFVYEKDTSYKYAILVKEGTKLDLNTNTTSTVYFPSLYSYDGNTMSTIATGYNWTANTKKINARYDNCYTYSGTISPPRPIICEHYNKDNEFLEEAASDFERFNPIDAYGSNVPCFGSEEDLLEYFETDDISKALFAPPKFGYPDVEYTINESLNMRAGRYILSGNPVKDYFDASLYVEVDGVKYEDKGSGVEFIIPEDTNVKVGAVLDNEYYYTDTIFYPMIRDAGIADDTFIPCEKTVETRLIELEQSLPNVDIGDINTKIEELRQSIIDVDAINEASGSPILITDSADGVLSDINLYGRSTQDGTPTSEAPVDIVSVADGRTLSVKSFGKNLMPTTTIEGTGYKSVNVSLPAGTYTITSIPTSSDTDHTHCLFLFAYTDGTYSPGLVLQRGVRNGGTVSATKEIKAVNVYAAETAGGSSGDTFKWDNIQIELGSIATDFEEYKEPYTIAIPLGQPLRSIENLKDELTCIDGKYGIIRRVGSKKYNASEFIDRDSTNDIKYFRLSKPSDCKSYGTWSTCKLLCNISVWRYITEYYSADNIGTINAHGGAYYYEIGFPVDTTLEQVQALGEIEVVYPLAQEKFNPFPDEYQELFHNISTYNSTTTLFATDNPEMWVEYYSNSNIGQRLAKTNEEMRAEHSALYNTIKTTVGYIKKNLLPNTSIGGTQENITITKNSDGTLTINGSCTNDFSYMINSAVTLEAGTYILNGNGIIDNYDTRLVIFIDGKYYEEFGRGVEFTLTTKQTGMVYLIVDNAYSYNNTIYKPMIRRAEITDDTYEPYVSDVKDNINIIKSTLGYTRKNLFDISRALDESNWYIANNFYNLDIYVGVGNTVTASFTTDFGTGTNEYIQLYNGTDIVTLHHSTSGNFRKVHITAGTDGYIQLRNGHWNGTIFTALCKELQIELGMEATSYEVYAQDNVNERIAELKSTLGYSCKNLIYFDVPESSVYQGITVTRNANRSVTLNGTVTGGSFTIGVLNHKLKKGRYTLSGVDRLSYSEHSYLYVRVAGTSNWLCAIYSGTKEVSFELTSDREVNVTFTAEVGETLNGTIYPMLRYAEITDNTYEPYVEDINTRLNNITSSTIPGLTATIEELNYMDGVTSNVQTQLDNKTVQKIITGVGNDYRKYVIALCNTYSANNGAVSFSSGSITFLRTNGLASSNAKIDFLIHAEYALANGIECGILEYGNGVKAVPCTFTYGGKVYGGIEVLIQPAGASVVVFSGTTNFDIFGVEYYDTKNSTALNTEIANSISYSNVTFFPGAYYNKVKLATIDDNVASATTLSGLTATMTELNYCKGVTSAIQTQLNGKSPTNHTHTAATLTPSAFATPAYLVSMDSSGHTGGLGYTTIAQLKTTLGLGSAAYTNSTAYAASTHTHTEYAPTSHSHTSLALNNNAALTCKNTSGTAINSLYMNTSNQLKIGYGAGTIHYGAYGTTTRMQFFASERVDFCISCNGTSDALNPALSITHESIYEHNSGQYSVSGTVLRPTTDNGGHTSLGSSSYPFYSLYYQYSTKSSDRKLKTDIKDLSGKYIALWDKLEAKSYHFTNDMNSLSLGLIAQDVETSANEVGLSLKDCGFISKAPLMYDSEDGTGQVQKLDENGEPEYRYGLDYTFVSILNLAKLKETASKVNALETQVAELQAKLAQLESV